MEKTHEDFSIAMLEEIKELQQEAVNTFLTPGLCGDTLPDWEMVFELAIFHSRVELDESTVQALHWYYQFLKLVRRLADYDGLNEEPLE